MNKKTCKKIILAIVITITFLTPRSCFSQNNIKFFDIIQEDSVRLYFNNEMEYTSEVCANYAR